MKYHLAQLNIAEFRLPQDHPDNREFIDNLDRVNHIAESQAGFIWRLKGEGNDAMDLQAFDNPNIASNMSVWQDMDSLAAFVYRNAEHRSIMRRRAQWFEKLDFYLVLWWIKEGHIPTIEEAKEKLKTLQEKGASEEAFTFRSPYPAPNSNDISPILDECG